MNGAIKKFDTLFLDRDGVLNRKIENGYVLKESDIEILTGVREFLTGIRPLFSHIVMVTNQRCIGRGLINYGQVMQLNAIINEKTGGVIEKFYVCPHLEEADCDCRKPKQGLFLRALEEFSVQFENSWMIGDSESDIIPAQELGINTIYVSDHTFNKADFQVKSTKELANLSIWNKG